MKRSFFHKEVIVKRGSKAESFFVVLKGKALVLNSMGNEVFSEIQENQQHLAMLVSFFDGFERLEFEIEHKLH